MRRTILAAWILLTFAPAAAGAPEDSCVDYTASVHWAGNLRTHHAFAVATYGPTAYVAADDSLYAVDISDPGAVRLLPSLDLGRAMQARALDNSGPYLLVGYGYRFLVVDARGSGSPIVTATLDLPGFATMIRQAGQRAYVACGDDGVAVVDLTDMARPRIVGRANTPGQALDIALLGDIAYIADYDWGVSVVDFSDPSVPAYVAFLPPVLGEHVLSCHVSFGRLYVGGDRGLRAYDLIDPAHPRAVTSLEFGSLGTIRALATSDFVVVAGQDRGIQLLDVVTGNAIAEVRLPAAVRDIEVQGDFAYIADSEAGFQTIRVRPLVAVAPIGGVAGSGLAVASSGSLAYFQNGGTLEIYDLASPSVPELLGSVGVPGRSIDVEAGLAVLTSTVRELSFVDVLEPHAPVLRSTWSAPGSAVDADLCGTLAYVACGRPAAGIGGIWNGFVVVDASAPETPNEIGRYKTALGTQAIRVRDDLAYIASDDSLHIVDVSDPAAPQLVGATSVGPVWNTLGVDVLDVDGGFAYVGVDRAVAIVEVSTPSSPRVVARVSMPFDPVGISVRSGVACVATHDEVEILDVLDPRAPRRAGLATLATAQWTAVKLADGALLVTNYVGPGLSIFPLPCGRRTPVVCGALEYTREPGTIHLRSQFGEDVDRLQVWRTAGSDAEAAALVDEESALPAGAWSYDDRAVQDEASYTYVLEIAVGGNVVRSAALLVPGSGSRRFGLRLVSANPSSDPTRIRFEIGRPCAVRLDVYDVAGHLVCNLHRGPAPGSHVAEWDGRDAAGTPAASGVYLVRLECGGEVATLRLVRTR